jgi:hypothetical protein
MSSEQTQQAFPDKQFYQSSNGDVWYLSEDPATGLLAVKHVANTQSGGHVSFLDVESFVRSGNGPEHQAFRELGVHAPTTTTLIAYDVHPASGPRYQDLTEAIQSLGAWWHHLETVWIVKSSKAAVEIRDQLQAYIGTDDQLLVVDISGVKAEWVGINGSGSAWLAENVLQKISG